MLSRKTIQPQISTKLMTIQLHLLKNQIIFLSQNQTDQMRLKLIADKITKKPLKPCQK